MVRVVENKKWVKASFLMDTLSSAGYSAESLVKWFLHKQRHGGSHYVHVSDPNDARVKWIEIDSLPEAHKRALEEATGDIDINLLKDKAMSLVAGEDVAWFVKKSYSKTQAEELAEACAWLRLSVSDFWRGVWCKGVFHDKIVICLAQRRLYGLRLSHGASLRRKMKNWELTGRESLVTGLRGNTNRKKMTEQAENYVLALYSNPTKPSQEMVFEMYSQICEQQGWAPVTIQTIRNLIERHKTTLLYARHGKEESRKYERVIARRNASFPDALWVVDGTTIQLYYYDEKTRKVLSDLYVVTVVDAHSRKLIGMSVGRTETSELVQSCLRDAVRKTGHLPMQIQFDNSSANKRATELFKQLATYAIPTAPYNGKAKVIEAIWGRVEGRYLRTFPNYKGGNITSASRNNKANPDFLKEQIKAGSLPDMQGVIAQTQLAVEAYNCTTQQAGRPNDLYATQDPRRRQVDLLEMVTLFWITRKEQVRYTASGLGIKVSGVKMWYEVEQERGVEDLAFRMKYLGDRFDVKYDPEDTSMVALYQNGVYLAMANEKYQVPMALADYQEGEGAIIHKAIAQRKQWLEKLKEEAESWGEGEEIGIANPMYMGKDDWNQLEGRLTDEALGIIKNPKPETPNPKQSITLYEVEETGEIIQ